MPKRPAPTPTREARASSEKRFDLASLFEFSSIINASLDLKFILGHFLLTIMGKLLSLRGIVLLRAPEGNAFAVETVKGLPAELLGAKVVIRPVPKGVLFCTPATLRKYPWAGFFHDHGIHLLVPLTADDRVLGVAGFAPSSLRGRLSPVESTYVRSLANIAASAVAKGLVIAALERSNRHLSGKIQELNTLFELGKEFNSVLDSERLIKLLMFSVMGQIGANRYALCLHAEGKMTVVSARLTCDLPEGVCEAVGALEEPRLVASLKKKSDAAVREALSASGIELLVPLLLQGETRGVLGLGKKLQGGEYTSSDMEFLASLGNLAIISIENARLFGEAIEKQKMEDELLIAKQIQRGLLPANLPMIPRCSIAAVNLSSKAVGGDYYDVIALPDGRFVIAIGDVSGKGAPASLLMANLQAAIRALVPLGLPLAELTKLVNDLLCDNTGGERFITFFWGILDVEAGSFRYVSAGHNPPMLFHPDGSRELLDKGGLILGIMKTITPYEEGLVAFHPGDLLVLYTDGVSEAMSAGGEEWGEERLEALVRSRLGDSPEDAIDRIVEAVKEHSRNAPQSDDITMVVLRMDR
jgi:sigma-B regulation protein RsbU (phosphoserine phosphatase)